MMSPFPVTEKIAVDFRHANSRTTLDLYAQAGMTGNREAQRKIVEMVLKKGKAVA